MIDNVAIDSKFKISNIIYNLKYKIQFKKDNPTYFDPDGLVIFVGPQGSGKTLSAVNYVCKLMELYPNAKLITNINIKTYPIVTFQEFIEKQYNKLLYNNLDRLTEYSRDKLYNDYYYLNRVFEFKNSDDLKKFENGQEGVIYLIDEIQLYFNSLQSKNINPDVMTEISQQRKQRKHIIATSQVFGRMAKPLREQFSTVVQCQCYLSMIQKNMILDRDSIEDSTDDMHIKGKVKHINWFTHSPDMYDRYDTFYKIQNNNFVDNEKKKGDIYDDTIRVFTSGQ